MAAAVTMIVTLAALGAPAQVFANAATERPATLPTRLQATDTADRPVRDASGARLSYRPSATVPAKPQEMAGTRQPAMRPTGGFAATWGYAAYGSGIGLSGIVVAQNHDHAEIYTGGSSGGGFGMNDYWYATRYKNARRGGEPGAEQVFVSALMPAPILKIAVVRAPAPQIVVALTNGDLLHYDQADKALLKTVAGPCAARGGLEAFAVADLNADKIDEAIAVCADGMLIASGDSYTTWSVPGVGGRDIVVGNLDTDAALEIATTSGQVIDSGSHKLQWASPNGFGAHLRLTDRASAGYQYLIAASAWEVVTAYDVKRKLPVWTLATPHDIGAVEVADVDGNGTKELFVGDGQWGQVKVYDLSTRKLLGSFENPEHGVTNIAAADVDGDGKAEVLWGAGASSTGPDHLYIGDWVSRTIVWQNDDLQGPFLGPLVGDLDGDGVAELVFASTYSNASYDSGRLIVLDSQTLAVRAMSAPVADNSAWTGVRDIKLRDVGGKGRMSIVVASDLVYDGRLEIWSFSKENKFERTWTNATRPTQAFLSVDVADLNGDGKLEVVGSAGNVVYAYDVVSGVQRWKSGALPGTVTALAAADLNGDGKLELACLVEGGDIKILDGAKHSVKATIAGTWTSMSTAASAMGVDLMLGNADGHVGVYAFNGVGYAEVAGSTFSSAEIDGASTSRSNDWWVGAGGTLMQVRDGRKRFETRDYGAGLGSTVTLARRDKLALTGSAYGVFGFSVKP